MESWFDPSPKFQPRAWPRAQPKVTVPSYVGESGLIGCWLLHQGAGQTVPDRSGNGNDADFVNTPVWDDGPFGWSLKFTEADEDYLEVAASPELNVGATTDEVSVLAWARSGLANWSDSGVLVSKRDQFILHPQNDLKDIQFYIYDGGWQGSGTYAPADITEWHLYGGSYDGSTVKFFTDGVLESSSSYAGEIDSDTGHLVIGKDDGNASWLEGWIALVWLFDEAKPDSFFDEVFQETRAIFGV